MRYRFQKVALIIPCFNEEAAIGLVIRDFKAALPELQCYVFDNRSSDKTAEIARSLGAVVIAVPLRGKGNVWSDKMLLMLMPTSM